jgi:Xaa-Pro aminopeptidase
VTRSQRLARLLRVLAAIVAEPGLNPLELADRAGVSERTLRRDLAELRELGYEVQYTSGYEVQEKLNLEGRAARRKKPTGDQELIQVVAQVLGAARAGAVAPAPEPARAVRHSRTKRDGREGPIVLIPGGHSDADFIYATGFEVESGLYVRYPDGEEVLAVSPLEFDRAREQSRVATVVEDREAYAHRAWAQLAARMLKEKGQAGARVSPRLHAFQLEDLRAQGIDAVVDRELFAAERRKKSPREADAIRACQRAAEAAVVEVAGELARAEIRDDLLWLDGRELTSERLYARAQLKLGESGFTCPEMIIAGSPGSALPHYRGNGAIRANAPVIIDVFPMSRETHYHGDLTRTVVVGEASEEVRRMHAAAVQALEAGVETIRAGVSGREVHSTVCEVLVSRGFGTTSKGFEGPEGVARMNHSTGHGVGLDVHEEPAVRETSLYPLAAGDVITVEPGLYKLELGGVRVEDTGMVTENGFENFTSLTYSLDPRDYL